MFLSIEYFRCISDTNYSYSSVISQMSWHLKDGDKAYGRNILRIKTYSVRRTAHKYHIFYHSFVILVVSLSWGQSKIYFSFGFNQWIPGFLSVFSLFLIWNTTQTSIWVVITFLLLY